MGTYGRTDVHVRKQLSLPAVAVGWPSGSIVKKKCLNIIKLFFYQNTVQQDFHDIIVLHPYMGTGEGVIRGLAPIENLTQKVDFFT